LHLGWDPWCVRWDWGCAAHGVSLSQPFKEERRMAVTPPTVECLGRRRGAWRRRPAPHRVAPVVRVPTQIN